MEKQDPQAKRRKNSGKQSKVDQPAKGQSYRRISKRFASESSVCRKCGQSTHYRHWRWIQCNDCHRWLHCSCVNCFKSCCAEQGEQLEHGVYHLLKTQHESRSDPAAKSSHSETEGQQDALNEWEVIPKYDNLGPLNAIKMPEDIRYELSKNRAVRKPDRQNKYWGMSKKTGKFVSGLRSGI